MLRIFIVIPKMFLALIIFSSPGLLFGQEANNDNKEQSFVIYPVLGYQPETSVQLGAIAVWILRSEDKSQTVYSRRSTLRPFFIYSFRNQILTEVNLDYYFGNGMNLNATMSVFSFPDFYFGIGSENDPDIKESYSNVYQQLQGQFYTPVKPRLFAGIAYDLHSTQIRDIEEGGLLETDNVNGLFGGNIFGLGPSIRYDSRDNVIYPTKGYFLLLEGVISHIGDFNYTRISTDLKKFFFIGSEKNIIGLQINGQFTIGTDIPFYKLPQLGGAERIRGIANASLYRDRQAVYSQIEYRRHLVWRIGMTAFAGMGHVAPSVRDINPKDFKYVVGLGGRFAVIPDQRLNLRFDFGLSNEGQTAFYLGLREAF